MVKIKNPSNGPDGGSRYQPAQMGDLKGEECCKCHKCTAHFFTGSFALTRHLQQIYSRECIFGCPFCAYVNIGKSEIVAHTRRVHRI